MIAPETVDPWKLPSVLLEDRLSLPDYPCIYFALSSVNRVLYIGKALKLMQRWKAHHRYELLEAVGGVRIAWLEVNPPDLLDEIESALLAYFKPPLNGLRLGNERASGLKELRQRVNLKLQQVAAELGVAESSVRNWEHGRSVPRLEQARHLLKLYNCSFDELCDAIALTRKEDEVSA